MTAISSVILSFDSPSARLAWLRQEHPTINRKLIDELLDEVTRVGRLSSQDVGKVALFVSDAAELWQDEQTRASALRIEAEATHHDKPELALQLYRQAVSLYQRLDLLPQATDASLGVSTMLQLMGKYAEAITESEKIIKNFSIMEDLYGLGRAFTNLGVLNSLQGHLDKAQQNFGDAREAFRQINDTHWLAITDVNEANVLEELKQFDEVKKKYLRAQQYFIEIDAVETALKIEHNLAYLHFSLGEYQKALQLFTQVGQQFGEIGSQRNEAMADLYRSEVYIALNQWERALKVVEKIRPVFKDAQMLWELGQTLINQAISLANVQKPHEAVSCCEQARSLMPDDSKSRVWHGLVDLYQSTISLQIGLMDDAEELATRAAGRFAGLGIRYRLAQSQQILGEIATKRADFKEAETQFRNALEIAQALNLSSLLHGCHHGLGQIYHRQRNFEGAFEHYEQAMLSLERVQGLIGAEDYKISYRSDKLRIYHEFVELCLTRNNDFYIRKAFEIIERSRARTLLDSLIGHRPTHKKSAESNQATARFQQLREELNWYYRQLFTPDTPLDSVEAIAELNHAIAERESKLTEIMQTAENPDALETWNQSVSALTMIEIQQLLPAQTTVISYFVMEQSLIIFWLDNAAFQSLRIELPKGLLSELLQKFRFQLNQFQLSDSLNDIFKQSMKASMNSLLADLYDLLVGPVLTHVVKGSHLVFVPYGPLHSVPFQGLYDGKEYVLENYSVSYAPSATFFSLLVKEDQEPSLKELLPPLLFGLNDDLITNAEAETQAIRKFYPTAEIFNGNDFVCSRLLHNQKTRSLIHLATHGNFRTQHPKLSALKAADGWVTLYDIEQMPETAKLITLSACDTGHNTVRSGDELIGFYKSFFASGAHTLILSHWPLHDETALALMTAFYQKLSAGLPVYLAQREAQLELIQTDHHPFHWAPFFIVGNPFLLINVGLTQELQES